MEPFHYHHNRLFCEEMSVQALAETHGTPLYVYSRRAFLDRFHEVRSAFQACNPLVACSVKANSNLSVLKLFAEAGGGADIVSGGELYRALKAGIPADRIVYAGVGKTAEEITYAIQNDIHLFNVESMPELFAVNRLAGESGRIARIGFRLNPDVDAKTHAKTTTGKKENKFGLPISEAAACYQEAMGLKHVRVVGMDVHLGSPLLSVEPYVEALNKLIPLAADLKRQGIPLQELDIGGGFGIVYHEEQPFTLPQLAERIIPLIKPTGLKLICEPGRYLTGNAGILVTRVLYIKKTAEKVFVITDACMNDLIRPAFYDSYHEVNVVERASHLPPLVADVVGPICESSDTFARARRVEGVCEGGFLALMSAGAYGFSMASNYNSRPRSCEILVEGETARVVRRRETSEDLVRGEV